MKSKYYFIGIVMLLIFSACKINERVVDAEPPQQKPSSSQFDKSKYLPGLITYFQGDLEAMEDMTEYLLDVSILPELNNVSVHQKVQYTNTEDVALEEIYFRVYPVHSGGRISISNLSLNGQDMEFGYENQETSLRINLPDALTPDETVLIEMEYVLSIPSELGGNYGLFIYDNDILALDKFYPTIPVFNQEGWQLEDPPINADLVYSDVAFFDVTVNAAEDLVLVASGTEVENTSADGIQTVRFLGGPQRDFYLAASERFISSSKEVGETLVTSYYPKEYAQMGRLVLEAASDALKIFNDRYGLYPYTELDLASTPMSAGGMEYAGAAAMSLFLYDPDVVISGLPGHVFLESATAHEVAHQWFFNQLMNDQIDEPWIDEGFAQFLTYIYYLDKYGSDAAVDYKSSWEGRWKRLDFAEIPIGKAAGDYLREEYSPIIYGRAPIFIDLLANKMGVDVFDQFVKDLVDNYRWGLIDTTQLIHMAEDQCDCELDALFDEWWLVD